MTQAECQRLTDELPRIRVGWGGSRRVCYRLGESGYCVKFYKPPEECAPGKMKRSIRRDVARRRFDERLNSCAQEVAHYRREWSRYPDPVRSALLPVVERVFDPRLGWGVFETYFANPDGTAVIPYEFEIRRQTPEAKREIYLQARALLLELIREGAYFFEPGNFHVLLGADGSIALKIVDFEPQAKTLLPLERLSAAYRRWKLRRKARRYLAHCREAYGIDVAPETEIG